MLDELAEDELIVELEDDLLSEISTLLDDELDELVELDELNELDELELIKADEEELGDETDELEELLSDCSLLFSFGSAFAKLHTAIIAVATATAAMLISTIYFVFI